MDRKEYMKKYYETVHKGKRIQRTCECGDTIGYFSLHYHRQTLKHKNNLLNINEQSSSYLIPSRSIHFEGGETMVV